MISQIHQQNSWIHRFIQETATAGYDKFLLPVALKIPNKPAVRDCIVIALFFIFSLSQLNSNFIHLNPIPMLRLSHTKKKKQNHWFFYYSTTEYCICIGAGGTKSSACWNRCKLQPVGSAVRWTKTGRAPGADGRPPVVGGLAGGGLR
jgi:hypothetical protein